MPRCCRQLLVDARVHAEHVGLSRVLGQFEADLGRSALAAAMGGTEKAGAAPDFEVLLRAIREQPEGDFGG